MSLGVLNNISALYAENNLNQTQSSLQNTLTQLSSGSRINSGSDDAAGLSLADGLTASSSALTQSASNATEGVDFLQVADGALSQMTSLLNRAVTLATEASNGTLNSAQQAATQSEYSSIMTEISTINGNTEYNGLNVFSDAANVFTSDGTVSQTYANTALGSASADSLNLGSVIYSSGTVAAATSSQVGKTDSYGNAISSGDNILAASGTDGKAVTVDLTAMGDKTTGVGALSSTNAVSISGNKAVAGSVEQTTANSATGTDKYGTTVSAGDYVFESSTATVYTNGSTLAATNAQIGTADANGNTIKSGDNILSTTNTSGKSIILDLTSMGDTTTAAGATLSDTTAVAVSGNTATAGSVAKATSSGTDSLGGAIAVNDYVFSAAVGSTNYDLGTQDPAAYKVTADVYTSGTVAAATTSQVGDADSNGLSIAAGDNLLTTKNTSGNSITLDLTAMGLTGSQATALGATLSDTKALSVTSSATGSATLLVGSVAASAAGTDALGNSYIATDYVFTSGTTVYSTGSTTDPATAGKEVVDTAAAASADPVSVGGKDTGSGAVNLGGSDPSKLSQAMFAGTSLDSTTQAAQALSAITNAISQVASIRGNEGAEVNTLTAVENVQTTQSTNTTSAENDVMATNYASTTSNLSKFEILEQTGISALAQANSTEQLVTKLLQ